MKQPAGKGVAQRKDVQRPIGMIRRQTQGEGERRAGLRKGEKRIPKGFDGQIIQWRIWQGEKKKKRSRWGREKKIVVRVRKRSGEKRRGENGGGRESRSRTRSNSSSNNESKIAENKDIMTDMNNHTIITFKCLIFILRVRHLIGNSTVVYTYILCTLPVSPQRTSNPSYLASHMYRVFFVLKMSVPRNILHYLLYIQICTSASNSDLYFSEPSM